MGRIHCQAETSDNARIVTSCKIFLFFCYGIEAANPSYASVEMILLYIAALIDSGGRIASLSLAFASLPERKKDQWYAETSAQRACCPYFCLELVL